MTPSEASTVQTFHQSIGKQLVAKDGALVECWKNLLHQTLLTGFKAWVEVSNSSGFLELLIFLIPLITARGRLRAEKKKRIKSHLFQIVSHESGIQA
jgi:hypothetical protein